MQREPFRHVGRGAEYFRGIRGLGGERWKYELDRDASGDEPHDAPPVHLNAAVARTTNTTVICGQSLVRHDDPQDLRAYSR
jgi:hypothetical protein